MASAQSFLVRGSFHQEFASLDLGIASLSGTTVMFLYVFAASDERRRSGAIS